MCQVPWEAGAPVNEGSGKPSPRVPLTSLSLPHGKPIFPSLPVSAQEAEMNEKVDDFVQEPQANLQPVISPRAGLGWRAEVLVWKWLPLRALSDPRQSWGPGALDQSTRPASSGGGVALGKSLSLSAWALVS